MNTQLESVLQGIEIRRFMDEVFKDLRKKYDLKKIELEVLYALKSFDDCDTPSEIASRLKLNRGHVSQAIDVLYKRRLIYPIPDDMDRRYMHYRLTDEAQDMSEAICSKYGLLEERVFTGISERELAIYTDVNRKLTTNIHEILVG